MIRKQRAVALEFWMIDCNVRNGDFARARLNRSENAPRVFSYAVWKYKKAEKHKINW